MAAEIPEGLPAHLFSRADARGWVLAVGEELDVLQLVPVNGRGERRAVIVEREFRHPGPRSVRTPGGESATTHGARIPRPRVVADPWELPFRDGAAAEVVVAGTPPASRELGRVLQPGGLVLQLVAATRENLAAARGERRTARGERRPARAENPVVDLPQTGQFVIWPIHGGIFLVTRSAAPDWWPFGSLHLGKPGAVLAAVYGWLSRRAPRLIPRRTLLILRSDDGSRTLVEERAETDGRSELALVVKADRNVVLLAEPMSEEPDGRAGGGPDRLISATSSRGHVVKFPLSTMMVDRTRRGVEVIARLRETHGPEVTEYLPRVSSADFEAPQPWSRERRLPGRAATRGWWIPGHYRKVAEQAVEFVIRLHLGDATRGRLTESAIHTRLAPPLQGLATACRDTLGISFPAQALLDVLRDALEGREVTLVRSHGDLWLPNLILDEEGELAGVLDWDQSREATWPLLDLLNLLTFRHRRLASRWFADLLRWRLLARRLARWEGPLVGRYMAALDLDRDLWAPLVVIYWLEFVALRTEAYRGRALRSAWMERNVARAAPRMLRALGRQAGRRRPGHRRAEPEPVA